MSQVPMSHRFRVYGFYVPQLQGLGFLCLTGLRLRVPLGHTLVKGLIPSPVNGNYYIISGFGLV